MFQHFRGVPQTFVPPRSVLLTPLVTYTRLTDKGRVTIEEDLFIHTFVCWVVLLLFLSHTPTLY